MIFRVLTILLLLPAFTFAFTVIRKDGKKFSGELIQQTEEHVTIKDADGITIRFSRQQIDWDKTTAALRASERNSTEIRSQEITISNETPKRPKWSGEPISVDFKEVDIRDFFRFIADTSGMNLILDPQVRGKLTLKMTQVPWDQVLDVVCRTHGYGWEIDGNVMSIDRQ